MYNIEQQIDIRVIRKESGFDRASDQAYSLALMKFGADDNGYFDNVKDFNRSTDSIIVKFIEYIHSGGMSGQEHEYVFIAWIERNKAT